MATSTLDLLSLPDELLILVFSNVALDFNSGSITAGVGRVCKLFHHLVDSSGLDVMYTSLRGTRTMETFLGCLEHRVMTRRRVHSLLVVADRSQDDENTTSEALRLLQSIISSIDSSCLHTLFAHFPVGSSRPTTCLQLPVLPALTDLHLSGLALTSRHSTPNLKRLQLLRILDVPSEYQDISSFLYTTAPTLTHFKMSLCTSSTPFLLKFTSDLGYYLCVTLIRVVERETFHRVNEDQHRFPASLESVAVRFDVPPADEALGYLFTHFAHTSGQSLEVIKRYQEEAPLAVLPSADVRSYESDGAGEDGRGYAEEFAEDWRT
ncbi:hypothetical protein EIP91_001693, partial [Steccherinum ochraceum]